MQKLLFACFWCVSAVSISAQSGAPDTQKKSRIEGQIVNAATGAPLRHAEIQLLRTSIGGTLNIAASTDIDGKFAVMDLEPGTYSLSVKRAGFIEQSYRLKSSGGEI